MAAIPGPRLLRGVRRRQRLRPARRGGDRHRGTGGPAPEPAVRQPGRQGPAAARRDRLRPPLPAGEGATLRQTMFSEQPVEIHPAPGVTVTGRVDLIKRLDTEEVSVVDFKSSERAQAEDVSLAQLHLYALGYRELTGADADLVEVHNLDEEGSSLREEVDTGLLNDLTRRVTEVGRSLRDNDLRRLPRWCATCTSCDFAGICRDRTDTSG
ncbi:PD-(D/E)XK nuclease family protein [Thermomonospora curvata]|uniref:PD-(D/E)XK nuclease family protein n=1 Tax=Thermomonospora curvata TaxID=2020 RepID=UPI001C266870|nr:PD-(D/E)XK nuclease family protein [Thermomonospora curvata]